MHPVLFSIGSLAVSTFGLFLALGLLSAVFVVWRAAKVYDIEVAQAVDLTILTFLGGFFMARVVFVALNLPLFDDVMKVIMVNRYPGLSFWGGLLGGIITFYLLLKRTKLNFWQVADFASCGALIGIAIGNLGCFFGGCAYGIVSDLPIATSVVGLVGKRFPITAIESVVLLLIFFYLWKQVIKFHFYGKITALFLIFLGLEKFLSECYRGDSRQLWRLSEIYYGHLFSLIVLVAGVVIFYKRSKRSALKDLKSPFGLLTSKKQRQVVTCYLKKSCYNHKVNLKINTGKWAKNISSLPKVVKRRLNVKSTPKNIS